jgi:TonB family protein
MRVKVMFISYCCALAIIGAGAVANAQEIQQDRTAQPPRMILVQEPNGEAGNVILQRIPGGPPGNRVLLGGWFGQIPDRTIQFASAEMEFDNKVVLNAPFSAEMVCENIQTLADGNRIVNRSTISIFRDGLGRTRREQVFNPPGQAAGGPNERRMIYVRDVAGRTTYSIDPINRTAIKSVTGSFMTASSALGAVSSMALPVPPVASKQMRVSSGVLEGSATRKVAPAYPPIAKAARAQGAVQVNVTIDENGNVTSADAVSGHPLLRDAAIEAAKQWQFKPTLLGGEAVKVQGLLTFNFTVQSKDEEPGQVALTPPVAALMPMIDISNRVKGESRTEQLGTQTVEGIAAEGIRYIDTIQAGAIGNERPIEIVRERWYSPELQMVILMKHVDPRYGESIQRLTNIDRSEPDASLFQVPDGYEVKESLGMKSLDQKFLEQKLDEIKKRRQNEQ